MGSEGPATMDERIIRKPHPPARHLESAIPPPSPSFLQPANMHIARLTRTPYRDRRLAATCLTMLGLNTTGIRAHTVSPVSPLIS
jgi:hypothetical protein